MRSFLIFVILLSVVSVRGSESDATTADSKAVQRSPAEWRQIINQQTIESKKYLNEHPQEALLLCGVSQSFSFFPKFTLPQWSTKYKEGYSKYQEWWKIEGESAFNSWRKAGFPALKTKYRLIFHAIAMGLFAGMDMKLPENADVAVYGNAIIKRGRELIIQGASGGLLSETDIDELRLYAMYNCYIEPGADYPLPTYVGAMNGVVPAVGDMAPDFILPQMEEILDLPTYSDQSPFDEMHVFRPDILLRFLNVMEAYTAPDAEKKKLGWLVQPNRYKGEFKNPTSLSSFQDKIPVLFMCEDASDTWDWSGIVVPLWGPFYEAVKGKAAIFLVDTTVHDQMMPDSIVESVNTPGERALHPTSLEAKARMAKMCYMTYPTLSVPYLLDDLGEHVGNAYKSGGGESSTFLVDKKGRVAFYQWQSPGPYEYMVLDTEPTQPYAVPARHQRVMNLVESNLKALLDAGGTWTKDMKPVVPEWRMSPGLQNIVLTGVDQARGEITATDANKNPITFKIDEQSRILQDGVRKTVANFKIGEVVSISYQKPAQEKAACLVEVIANANTLDWFWYAPANWVSAAVQAVDVTSRTITIKLTLHLDDCKGIKYWKTATSELTSKFGPYAKSIPQFIDKLTADIDKSLTIHIDRATTIFIDGTTANLSDVKVGDLLGLDLPNDYSVGDTWVHFIRVYRF